MNRKSRFALFVKDVPLPLVILFVLILSATIFVAIQSVVVVETGTRGVLKNFGQIVAVLDEGLHIRLPFVSSVVIVDVRTQRYQSNTTAASRDLQIVTSELVLNYRIDPTSVDMIIREIGLDYEIRVIEPAVQEALKASTAKFTAEELITRRPEVSQAIRASLESRLSKRGIFVEDVSITDFDFSDEFTKAIEAKQVAEQDALRAQNELRRAQIVAQQQVARAEAEAKARLEVARAEAEALRLQRAAISPELIQLRFIEKWDGVLPRVMSGADGLTIMLPVDLGSTPSPTPIPTPKP